MARWFNPGWPRHRSAEALWHANSARATPAIKHNWAGNITWPDAEVVHPRNLIELLAAVREGIGSSSKVGGLGFGGAWSPTVPGRQRLISMAHLRRTLHVDHARTRVTVEAGMSTGELDRVLRRYGWCVPTTTVIPYPNLGGVIATGAHGTGIQHALFADLVVAMDVVGPDGELTTYHQSNHDLTWRALMVNLGALGIVYSVTIQAEPMFRVHVQDIPHTWSERDFMNDSQILASTLENNDYVELFWWPFSENIWLKLLNRTTDPVRGRIAVSFENLKNGVGGVGIDAMGSYLARNPTKTPEMVSALYRLIQPTNYVCEAPIGFHYQRQYPKCWDLCYIIPITTTPTTWKTVAEKLHRSWNDVIDLVRSYGQRGKFPLNIALHARFLGPSQGLLAPNACHRGSGKHVLIEILSYKETPTSELVPFYEAVETAWRSLGGVPHWAKCFSWGPGHEPRWTASVLPTIRSGYEASCAPNSTALAAFRDVRNCLDPNRRFLTPLVEEFLGI